MLEALISYFPIREPGFAGVGALDYSKEERKKLAILSQKFKCDKCGSLIEILPILKKEEEKKPEEIKIQDNILLKNENENEQIDDPLKNHQDSNKLAYELKNLKETIKEQQAKFNIPFLKNVGNNLKKNDENRVPSNKFEKNSISLTFDSGKQFYSIFFPFILKKYWLSLIFIKKLLKA